MFAAPFPQLFSPNLQPGCPRGRHCGATGVPPNCLGGREGAATGWREHRWGGKGRQVPRHRCVAERRDCATTSNNTGGGGRCPPRASSPREEGKVLRPQKAQRDGDNRGTGTAGRGQQRDGDNSGSAGRRPAALAAFPRRQRPHGRALGFSPTPTPRFPPTAAPAAERRRVVDSRLSPLRTSTDGDRGRHRSSAWGGIRAPGVARGSGAAPRGLTPLPLRPPGPPSRYSPAAAHSSTRGRAPPPPRRTPSAIAAAAAAALTPRPRCGPAPLR